MTVHYDYGGSTASRTLHCAGWRKEADKYPNNSSSFADEGNLLHDGMERIYTSDKGLAQSRELVVGMEYKGITLTDDLFDDKIQRAIDAIETIFDTYNVSAIECESQVKIFENAQGTADVLARGSITLPATEDEPEVTISVGLCIDYKFGSGIMVDAFENDQGLFYSSGASVTPAVADIFEGVDLVVIGIVQPNDRGGEDFSIWEVSPDLLTMFIKDLRVAIDKAEGPNPEFNAGKWCDFCPARGMCPATSGELEILSRIDLTHPEIVENLPTYDRLQEVKATIKAIEKFIYEQIDSGAHIPTFKIVPKQARRAYTDLEAVEAIVKKSRKIKKEDAYDFELKSPTQLQKVFKKKGLDWDKMIADEYVTKRSSGTTLVGDDDDRDEVPGLRQLASLLSRD